MPFLAPLALAGLVFVPLVVAMYLLKLRRDEAVVPSTLLWQRLVADVEANAPWQRLRRSLLLLLQLLLVVILVLLAARPFVERPAGLAGDLVLVIDTSASMQATDVTPNRLEAAKAAAIDALKDLPAGGKVSVIAAGRTAKVVANGTGDIGRVRQAIASVTPTSDIGNLSDALRLASALAARSGDAEILVATDAALATPPTGTLEAPVRVLRVGRDAVNQAIVALAVRTAPSGLSHSAFISVANVGLEQADRQLQLYADGRLRDSRTLHLDPQRRTDVSIDDIDDTLHPASVGRGPARRRRGRDGPDRRWARRRRPRVGRRAAQAEPADPARRRARPVPRDGAQLPARHRALLPRRQGLVDADRARPVRARHLQPLPARHAAGAADPGDRAARDLGPRHAGRHAPEPRASARSTRPTRSCATSTSRPSTSARPTKLDLPAWARSVIPGPSGSPLLYSGTLDGRARRGPRVRAAALGPPAPGRVPGAAREPLGRADGRLRHAARRRRARRAGHPAGPRGRARRPRGAARRQRRRAGRADEGRRERDVRADRPARDLHRVAAIPDPDASAAPSGAAGSASPRVRRPPRGRSPPPTPRPARRSGRQRPAPRRCSPSTSSTSTNR